MAIYYTARKGLKSQKKSFQELINQSLEKDIIVINQKKVTLPRTLESKGGLIIQGEEGKPKPDIYINEREAGILVGASMRGPIKFKHVNIIVGDSSIGFRSNSDNCDIEFDDVNIIHKKSTTSPYRSLIIDTKGTVTVRITSSLIDSLAIQANMVIIKDSNIGDWFLDDSSIVANHIEFSNTAIQNILLKSPNINGLNGLFGGNVRFDQSKGALKQIQLACLPALNFRGNIKSMNEESTSLIVGENSDIKVIGLKEDNQNFSRIDDAKKIELPSWRGLGVVGGTLLVESGELTNTPLKNIARSGTITFENVQDDSSWEVGDKSTLQLSNRNSKSELFNQALKSNDLVSDNQKSALDKLDEMIGLDGVKDRVKQMVNQAAMNAERKKRGIDVGKNKASMNMVFAGSPGTGKTVVARLVGQALYEAGVLKSTKFNETTGKDFIDDKVGGSGIKSQKIIDDSLDGILFIDEAYGLAPPKDGGNSFHDEIMNVLIPEFANKADRLVVIMAGYSNDMKDFFNRTNAGMKSRVPNWIEFPDYSIPDLKRILRLQLKRNKVRIRSKETMDAIDNGLVQLVTAASQAHAVGNGRLVENYIQKLTEMRDDRLSKSDITSLTDEQLTILETDDAFNATKTMENQFNHMN